MRTTLVALLLPTCCACAGPTGARSPDPATRSSAIVHEAFHPRAPERAAPLAVATGAAEASSATLPAPIVAAAYAGPRSGLLRTGLRNPLPAGVLSGYVGDTGLDIASKPRTVYAIAAAKLDYAEAGHTRWIGKGDTPFCVRLELDTPIAITRAGKPRKVTHVYYAHLTSVLRPQTEGHRPRAHVEAGEPIGVSGTANGLPHLHLGLLLDGQVEQDDWTYILREHEVRDVLGGYATGKQLPKDVDG